MSSHVSSARRRDRSHASQNAARRRPRRLFPQRLPLERLTMTRVALRLVDWFRSAAAGIRRPCRVPAGAAGRGAQLRIEPLEARRVLATLYVDNPGDFVITNDQGASGLDNGDEVTWVGFNGTDDGGAGDDVTGLTFGSDAFGSIQDAVDAAAPSGDMVDVAPGMFNESIAVNKSLTLRGAQNGASPAGRTAGGAGETVVQAVSGQNAFSISASNVTIDGFDIDGASAALYGVAETTPVTGTIVSNNFIHDVPNLGVAVAAGSSGAAISGNEIYGNYAGVYLSVGASDVQVVANEIRDHAGGALDQGSAVVFEGNNTSTSVTQNVISENATGLYLWDAFGTDFTGTSFSNNSVTPAAGGQGVVNTNASTIDASGNWWGSNDETVVAGSLSGPVDVTPFLDSGTDTDSGTPGFQGDFSVLNVTTLGVQTGSTGRIQEGIDLVTAGGTVNVLAGTYDENLLIGKALTLSGAVDGGGAPDTTIAATSTVNKLIQIDGTSFGADETVTIENFSVEGVSGTINHGIYVESSARLDELVVQNSAIEGFDRTGIFIFGDPANGGISVGNVTLADLEFSDNGTAGGGGAADIQFWQYNGDASLTDLTLVGSSSGLSGVQSGIQFRGIGDGDGANELPMGAVSLDNVDVSGTYRTQFIGIQRYSDVSSLTFNDVALGGAGSQITGTFGAALRFDATGTGTPASPDTIDLGNTYFRGLDDYAPGGSVFVFDIEFAPDNAFAFLRADATDTRWNTSGGTDVTAANLTLSELFEVEDRILHYVEPDHPTHMGPFRGFAEVRAGNAYITDTFQSIIGRGIEMAASGGTVHVAAGNYSENSQVVIDHDVSVVGEDRATTIITPSGDTGSSGDARGWFLVDSGVEFNVSSVTFDGLSGTGRKVFTALRHNGSGTINDVAFQNVKFSKYIGLAIETTEDTTNVDVTNSTFDNIQRLGVLYKFAGTTGTFSGNTYTGKGTGDHLDYALDISAGADIEVFGNTITGNRGVAASDGSTSAGILVTTFFGPGTVSNIHNNFINDNTTGVYVGYEDDDTSSVTIFNNDLSGNDVGVVSTNPIVDASGNWWGTTDDAAIADSINNAAISSNGVSGDADKVDFTPLLESGADTDSAAGFQGDFSTLHVSALGAQTGATGRIQEGIDLVTASTVIVHDGTYNESPSITKSLTLESLNGRDNTTIALQSGPTYLGSLSISGSGVDVTVDGFTIQGRDAVGAGLAASNILLGTDLGAVQILNNRIQVGQIGAGTNGDDGIGLLTTFNTSADTTSLIVDQNIFEPLSGDGNRAFYINPGVNEFVFENNDILGHFTGTSITQAKDGLVENTVLTGTGSSAGLGTWGFPDPDVYGHTIFRANNITQTANGISIFDSNGVTIDNNALNANGTGIRILGSIASIENNDLNGNTIGVLIQPSGGVDSIVDLGSGDAGSPLVPGLPVSAGGNDFTGYTTTATSTSGAIVNLNSNPPNDGAGSQGYPADVPAVGNSFTGGVSDIEDVIWHDADNSGLGRVVYLDVHNLALTLSDDSINEHETITLSGSFDHSLHDHTVTIVWGDGFSESFPLAAGQTSFSRPHLYRDDNPSGTPADTYDIHVFVSGPSGELVTASTDIDVANVAPSFTSLSLTPSSVPQGGSATLEGTFSDPGILDTFELDVDWDGDGTFDQTVPVAFGSFSVSHTFSEAPHPEGTRHAVNVRLSDDDTGSSTSSVTVTVTPPPPASVLDVHLFYNGSKFDNNDLAVTTADFAAIAPDKDPLLFGGTGSFANISGYSRGINGVFFDVANLPSDGALLTAGDLAVSTGNSDFPDTWSAGPVPTDFGVFANIDGSGTDRIFVTFADGAIANTWVRLSLAAGSHTGLASAADFFFASVPGETGAFSQPGVVSVDGADLQSLSQNISILGNEPITSTGDLNRDGNVDGGDLQVMAQNIGIGLVDLITPQMGTPALAQPVTDSEAAVSLAAKDALFSSGGPLAARVPQLKPASADEPSDAPPLRPAGPARAPTDLAFDELFAEI